MRSLFFLLLIFLTLHSAAQKVGLVLSGGGARGMAHIGVIKALEENHIPIDYIAGTSAGAIIGSMYAQGYSPHQMDSIVRSDDFYNWANGIIDDDYTYYFRKSEDNASWITLRFSLDSLIQTRLPVNLVNSVPVDFALMENNAGAIAAANYNFDSLFIPYRCVAADIENKQTLIFRNGDLGQAVRASAAFPFYFKPVLFDGKILYDGGMYNNFPADVMLNEFQPDIIIGVNAGGSNTKINETNIISQVRTMMTTPTNFSVLCENGILIEPYTDDIDLFDFNNVDRIIQRGFDEAMKDMDRVRINVQRRVSPKELQSKREAFRNKFPQVIVDKVFIEGVSPKQSEYIRQIIKRSNSPVPMKRLKSNYFELVADENIKSIYPRLQYNQQTGFYDMYLRIVRERDLVTQFGGNISTRPISEAFVGMRYNLWNKKSYSFSGNVYFGKLYNSGMAKVRMDVPSHPRLFVEAEALYNSFDFYKSSYLFFEDEKPAYIIQSEFNFGLNTGLPLRNKGKLVASAYYNRLSDLYYQTTSFSQSDTADETRLKLFTGSLLWERNTLDRKQYATAGTFLSIRGQYISGDEYTFPGSTNVTDQIKKNYHNWFQAKIVYDNYFKRRGRIRFGFYAEGAFSTSPFLGNYLVTSLEAPAFQPIAETKTLYFSNFRAHIFAGGGIKSIVRIKNNFDFRLEGYLFQPYQNLLRASDGTTFYGQTFEKRYVIASGGFVFNSPLGPASLFLNYYDDRKNPISLLFHFGYVIFNKRALQ